MARQPAFGDDLSHGFLLFVPSARPGLETPESRWRVAEIDDAVINCATQ
jgi:hypothetical protein